MAKSEGRGWKSLVPSVNGVIKFFILSVVLHALTSVVYPRLPEGVKNYWPRT